MDSIGNYAIEATIGAGGSGTVYRSTHPVLRRPVAVKVLHDTLSHDGHARERFLREARLALDLRHPGIVTLYDIGASADRLYLVMQLFPNGSLADAAAARRLPLSEVLAAGAAIAGALAYAHRMGVVHRDVKPSNILLGADGTPVVADFGIALDRAGGTLAAAGAAQLCTPAYCAPEQIQGRPTNARSDIYAFGVLLYELVAGQLPFDGTAEQVVFAHLRSHPAPLRTLNPLVPPELDALVQRLLAKDPLQRPVDMEHVAAVLRSIDGHTAPDPVHNSAVQSLPRLQSRRWGEPTRPAIGVTTRISASSGTATAQGYVAPWTRANRVQPAAGPLFAGRDFNPPVAPPSSGPDLSNIVVNLPVWLGIVLIAVTLVFPLFDSAERPRRRAPSVAAALPSATPRPSPSSIWDQSVPATVLDRPSMRMPRLIRSGPDQWNIGNVGVYQEAGSIRVYGIVHNAGARVRYFPVVQVTLRDADGKAIASSSASTMRALLARGEYSGFRVVFDDRTTRLPEAGQFTVDFDVQSFPAPPKTKRRTELVVTGVRLARTVSSLYRLTGYVARDPAASGDGQVHAVFFDADGRVTGIGSTAVDHQMSPAPASTILPPSTRFMLVRGSPLIEQQPSSMWVVAELESP